jgi:oxygen-independent coproporphyrinogen-3 oxidase
MGIDRTACYSYAHVPWLKKHQRVIDEATLPARPQKLELFATAWRKFTEAGFVPVGMDHFARRGRPMAAGAPKTGRCTATSWATRPKASDDMVAFGVTAIADGRRRVRAGRARAAGLARGGPRGPAAGAQGLAPHADDEARRAVILDLMCRFRVRYAEPRGAARPRVRAVLRGRDVALQELEREGMLALDEDGIA